jgi:hypothetical protein
VFGVWLVLRLGAVQDWFYRNSDNSSALVLAELLDKRGPGDVVLGDYLWLEPLYALHLTRWLPAHREVWEAAPFVLYGATLALIGWTVARTTSRRLGLAVALAMAAPTPIVLQYLTSPNSHAHSLLHAVILAGFLIALPQVATAGRTKAGLWAVGLAITLAPGAASDPILLVAGVLPFLLAVGLGWRLRLLPRGASLLAAAACLAGTGIGLLSTIVAKQEGIRTSGVSFPLASPGHALENAWRFIEDVALFLHGRLDDPSIPDGFDAILVIGTVLAVPVLAIAVVLKAPDLLSDARRSAKQRLIFLYWGLSVAALFAAFVASSAPIAIDSTRYLLIAWPALLTLAAIAFERRAATGVALLAAVTGILGCIELARGSYWLSNSYSNQDIARLERFLRANRIDHGYASYEYAAAIMRLTDFEVRLYPLESCGRDLDKVCPSLRHHVDAWYEGEPGVRTFYLFNPNTSWRAIRPPPVRWGEPAQQAQIGPFRLFVYDFDLGPLLRSGDVSRKRPVASKSPS